MSNSFIAVQAGWCFIWDNSFIDALTYSREMNAHLLKFCGLTVQSTIFQLCWDSAMSFLILISSMESYVLLKKIIWGQLFKINDSLKFQT